jgi:hypothetical protein
VQVVSDPDCHWQALFQIRSLVHLKTRTIAGLCYYYCDYGIVEMKNWKKNVGVGGLSFAIYNTSHSAGIRGLTVDDENWV